MPTAGWFLIKGHKEINALLFLSLEIGIIQWKLENCIFSEKVGPQTRMSNLFSVPVPFVAEMKLVQKSISKNTVDQMFKYTVDQMLKYC